MLQPEDDRESGVCISPAIQLRLTSYLDGKDYDKLYINMSRVYRQTLEFFEWSNILAKRLKHWEGLKKRIPAEDMAYRAVPRFMNVTQSAFCNFHERSNTLNNNTCFADICCDLDGVLHSYASGWQKDATVIPDPPVEGAIETLYTYLDAGLSIAIFSARSAQPVGIQAMREWLSKHDREYRYQNSILHNVPHLNDVIFMPDHKPAAKVYIDDRGFRFEGSSRHLTNYGHCIPRGIKRNPRPQGRMTTKHLNR